jgi:hypothetical protein
VPFDLRGQGIGEFIRHAFKEISVRLVTQTLRDKVLVVAEPDSAQDLESQDTARP